jgi:hypothetical protein
LNNTSSDWLLLLLLLLPLMRIFFGVDQYFVKEVPKEQARTIIQQPPINPQYSLEKPPAQSQYSLAIVD